MARRVVVLLALLILPSLLVGAQTRRNLKGERGTIVEVGAGSGRFGIVPAFDPGTRYAPDRLPAELQKDGLCVVFSGREGVVPPNVRMWGTPLELKAIKRAPCPSPSPAVSPSS